MSSARAAQPPGHVDLDHRVDEALRVVLRPGQQIVIGQGVGAPTHLVAALGRHTDLLAGSTLLVGLLPVELPELPDTTVETFYPAGRLAAQVAAGGRVRYVRRSLFELSEDLRTGARPVDVVLAQAGRPRAGRRSLGSTVDLVAPALDGCAGAVLETGDHVSWSGPRSTVADRPQFHPVEVPAPDPGPVPVRPEPPDALVRLAATVLPWIPDGATLELGIGRWAAGLTAALTARRGLRIHTGALDEWVDELVRARALAPGPVVATDAGGAPDLLTRLARGPGVDLAPAHRTHALPTLRALPRFRAVNSVFEVDLAGRANAEHAPDGRRRGIAGLRDFARGAAANPDGLAVLALPAGAGRSRIVSRLPDDRVSLDTGETDVVVTEYGSAYLRGASPGERRERLLAVADPRHRADLACGPPVG
ncbi:acetyl-CoA hydrolase/transferase C-terminal domain-containing protein [Pseudonocardia sp. GCM10023141]|uniref:acetyl-CoA hydrolase/transferase C-terminal domain-containing protein n=1 Tax=Pseudonocardia sp. GCM10023141 TaxID=3252653 RepID=UPI00361ED88C